MKKIAILSHKGGNIGHDFMSIGVEIILDSMFGDKMQIEHFEQHHPFDVYSNFHPLRLLHSLPYGRFNFLRNYIARSDVYKKLWRTSRRLDFDLAIACGGPNIIRGASQVAEMKLLLLHMNGAFQYHGVPFVDAAVGACFPFEDQEILFKTEDDRIFYRQALEYVSEITVREKVAAKVVQDLTGRAPEVLPCTALASGTYFERYIQKDFDHVKDGYVLINFMPKGANEDWGQGVDESRWKATIDKVISNMSQRHKVVMLAQNNVEANILRQEFPDVTCLEPRTVQEYGEVIAKAKIGLVSRIHAAIPMAGIGTASIVIVADTRMGTVENIGLPAFYVKNADADVLVDTLENMITNREQEAERLIQLREETINSYKLIFERNMR